VITGIHRDHPLNYRVAIGVDEQYMRRQMSRKMRLMAMVYRMQDMTPSSSHNLDILLDLYSRSGRVILLPGQFNTLQPGMLMDEENYRLRIELSRLTVVPAWQIDANSSLIAATQGIEDPLIPPNVTAPPFAEVLRRLNERKPRRGS